jgi:transcriptional regulator with XRE-family HTH domain
MSKAIEFLKSHESSVPSRWREDATWRRENEFWLKYARHITLQVLQAMENQSVTQLQLAKLMGCSQQYVSNLLKGSSNMTLETIARLELALNLDILKSAFSYMHEYEVPQSSERLLFASEPETQYNTKSEGDNGKIESDT